MSSTVGSLFSGIGGLDLGLERAGMTVRWQAETDPYCSRVLAKHWPHVPNLGDVTTVDWETVERVDLICGGYPCQPFSYAGTRQGTDDARHLWPHFAESLRVLRPRYALLENVPGHLSLGFGEVLGDLADLGYDTEWECIPAAAVGAPHLRYRVFVVAYAQDVSGSNQSGIVDSTALVGPVVGAGGRVEHGNTAPRVRVGGRVTTSGTEVPAYINRESEPGEPVDAFTRPGKLVPDTDRSDVRDQPESVGRRGGTPVARDDGTNGHVADSDSAVGRSPGSAGEAIHEPETVERPGRRGRILGDTFGTSADSLAAFRRSWGPTSESGWWAVEPDVGGTLDGFSAWLDGSGRLEQACQLVLAHGNAAGVSSAETVRSVRGHHGASEAVEWEMGRRSAVPPEAVLLTFLRQLESRCRQAGQPVASPETSEASVRGVRLGKVTPCPPLRRSAKQQRSGEPPDALHALSQLLARAAGTAWAAYRRSDACPPTHWESGVARVAHGVPARVDRLRSLGNAVVPQVAEWIGHQLIGVL